jgi:hypothetical protein
MPRMEAEILTTAGRLHLEVDVASPDDGVTRYDLKTASGRRLFTARGQQQAMTFLAGYEAGWDAGHAYEDGAERTDS